MATYLKRTSKLFDPSLTRAPAEVNLRDLLCPVCRGILIEPVTLPCTHNLCLGCLKGTFEHNSLSCPLCRVRVGSWLRTATKSETLVNNALWELIRTRFPKEVEGKHNGDDGDVDDDSGFTSKKVILSAAGEIRREYESQLRMAEEEMRRQRETERIANEALIRKIRAEEQQQLAQLAQDQLMAKNLAKKQSVNKDTECSVTSTIANEKSKSERTNATTDDVDATNFPDSNVRGEKKFFGTFGEENSSNDRNSNVGTIGKIRNDRYVAVKTGSTIVCKDVGNEKICGQKTAQIHNAVTRTLKHRTIGKFSNPGSSNVVGEPSCSTTGIYGSRSKEELRVPKDVLSSKKKSLGVEVCMQTIGEDDERIGSAESAGSHDSINQEIHHFKPIKPMARTALKMSYDGRPIDPKLVRVIPVLKWAINAVPKPPSPTHVKRIIGCSWSAFRGKARQILEQRQTSGIPESDTEINVPSTSSLNSHQNSVKLSKSQLSETVRRIDLAPDSSYDGNKNYSKTLNRTLNGAKVSKRLLMDETPEITKSGKTTKISGNKNVPTKNKRQRNLWTEKKNIDDVDDDDDETSNCSTENSKTKLFPKTRDDGCTIENIAERIKRRKLNREAVTIVECETETTERVGKRRLRTVVKSKNDYFDGIDENSSISGLKRKPIVEKIMVGVDKRRRASSVDVTNDEISSEIVDSSIESKNEVPKISKAKKTATNRRKTSSRVKVGRFIGKKNCRTTSENENFANEVTSMTDEISEKVEKSEMSVKKNENDTDEEIIEEQKRMERLIRQEKEDFELALRLQAQFNDMERIAGRTRGSRRAMENGGNVGSDLKTGRRNTGFNDITRTANRENGNRDGQSCKQRRKPQKHAVK